MTDIISLRWLRLAGIAGVIGAVLWTLGDILLIGANAQAADFPLLLETYAARVDTDKAAMMLPSSEARLAPGALVANVGIVFYLAGSWHLFRGLLPAGRGWAWPVFVLLLCGNAWAPLGHAAYYYLGMVYKTLPATPPDAHDALLDLGAQFHHVLQIAWSLPIVTLGLALLGLGISIALGRTAWPRWFALVANPVSLVVIGTAIAVVAPEPVATWLGGAAFNLGLLVVYLLSTLLLWNGGRRPSVDQNPDSRQLTTWVEAAVGHLLPSSAETDSPTYLTDQPSPIRRGGFRLSRKIFRRSCYPAPRTMSARSDRTRDGSGALPDACESARPARRARSGRRAIVGAHAACHFSCRRSRTRHR